jgi:hypothetical protein
LPDIENNWESDLVMAIAEEWINNNRN